MESTISPIRKNQSVKGTNILLRYPLVSFVLLAYLITWVGSIFLARGLLPFTVPAWTATPAVILYHFGPSFAGIIMAAMEARRTGVRALLRPLGRLRVGIGWYAFAILYPIVLRLVATGLVYALGGPAPSFFASASQGLPPGNPLLYAPIMFLGTLILGGLGEEIGWRGYVLPKLQSRYSSLIASLIIWVIWTLWHYHPFAIQNLQTTIPLHMLSVLGGAILYTWVYNHTGGNLWIVVLLHGCWDFADWVVMTSPAYGGSLPGYIAYIFLNLAVALFIVFAYRKNDPGRLPSRQDHAIV